MRHLITIFALSILSSMPINSAFLPNLCERDRQCMATDIVEGFVLSSNEKLISAGADYADQLYTVRLLVKKVIKGSPDINNRAIIIEYWMGHTRPLNWIGPMC